MPRQHQQFNPQNEVLLKEELAKAYRAQRAYEEFIAPFVSARKEAIWDAFDSTDPSDTMRLAELRRMSIIVSALDEDIKSFMTTGQMAKMQLEGEKDAS